MTAYRKREGISLGLGIGEMLSDFVGKYFSSFPVIRIRYIEPDTFSGRSAAKPAGTLNEEQYIGDEDDLPI